MTAHTRSPACWLALPLVVAQLLLSGAAVPHCHGAAVTAGPNKLASGQRSPSPRPHRHWAWGTHAHADGGHAHGARPIDSPPEPEPSAPGEHDFDAIALGDAFLVAAAGGSGHAPEITTAWITTPFFAAPILSAEAGGLQPAVRPPGDLVPPHHALLPHVLRI